jgi:hypothetical protein
MGAHCVPNNFWQAIAWFHSYIPHMEKFYVILIASICWIIWNIRNKVTFEKHILRSPSEISFFSISLMLYWAGLQEGSDKACLADGAAKLASSVFAGRITSAGPSSMLMITGT